MYLHTQTNSFKMNTINNKTNASNWSKKTNNVRVKTAISGSKQKLKRCIAPYLETSTKIKQRENNIKNFRNLKREDLFPEPQVGFNLGFSEMANAIENLSDTAADIDVKSINSVFQTLDKSTLLEGNNLLSSLDSASSVLGDAATSLKDVNSTIQSLGVPEIAKMVRQFANSDLNSDKINSIFGVAKVVNNVSRTAEGLGERINDIRKRVMEFDYGKIAKVAAIPIFAYYVYTYVKEPTSMNASLLVAMGLVVTYFVGYSDVSTLITDLVSRTPVRQEDLPVPEIDLEHLHDAVKAAVIALVGYVTFSTDIVLPKDVIKSLMSYERVLGGAQSIVTFFVKMLEKIVNAVKDQFCAKDPSFRFFSNSNPFVEDIISRYTDIEKQQRLGTLLYNDENYSKVTVTIRLITQFLREQPRNPITQGIVNELTTVLARLTKLQSVIGASNYNKANSRQEPASLLFRGTTGVFKSVVMNDLAVDICMRTLPDAEKEFLKENLGNYLYYKGPSDKWWDMYKTTHHITFLDDFGQEVSVVGAESNPYSEIIRMVNSAPYPLRMADVDAKGKMFFNSKFVLATTNLTNGKTDTLIDSSAFTRRWDLIYTVLPTSEKARVVPGSDISKIDVSKLSTITLEDGSIVSQILVDDLLYVPTTIEGVVTGPPQTYKEVLEACLRAELRKRRYYEATKIRLNKILEKPEPQGFSLNTIFPERKTENLYDDSVYSDEEKRVVDFILKHWTSLGEHKFDSDSVIHDFHLYHDHRFVGIPDRIFLLELYHTYGIGVVQAFSDDWIPNELRRLLEEISGDFRLTVTPLPAAAGLWKVLSDTKDLICGKFYEISGDICQFIKWSLEQPLIYNLVVGWVLSALLSFVGSKLASYFVASPPLSESAEKSVPKSKIERNSKKIKSFIPRSEAGADPSGSDLITSVVRKNMYEMTTQDGKNLIGYALFITSNIFVIPYHFVTRMAAQCKDDASRWSTSVKFTRLSVKKTTFSYRMTMAQIVEGHSTSSLLDSDLVLVRAPRSFQLHKDITSYFVTESDLKFLVNNMDFQIYKPENDGINTYTGHCKMIENQPVLDIDGTTYTIDRCYVYRGITTGKGSCGSLVANVLPTMQKRKVMAIHTAGMANANIGYSSVLTQEMILKALANMGDYDVLIEDQTPEGEMAPFNSGNFSEIGPTKTPRTPSKVDITPSRLFMAYPEVHKPLLKPAGLDTAYVDGSIQVTLDKYSPSSIEEPADFESVVIDELNWLKAESINTVDKTTYCFEWAVAGHPHEQCFRGVDRSTSSGYPWNLSAKTSKKSYFWGTTEDFNFSSVESKSMNEEVDSLLSSWDKGIRVPQPYSIFPKGELLPLEKVGVRVVAGCTTPYLIAIRMLFGPFMLWVTKNCVFNGMAVGMNPYSNQWDLLAKKLLAKNPNTANAGDFSGFDRNLQNFILWRVLDLINLWFSDGKDHMRKVAWYEIVNPRWLWDGYMIELCNSMSSGNPLTAIINCLSNKFVMRWTWSVLVGNRYFNESVYLIVQGDDQLFTVHPDYADLFNEFTIIEPLKAVGMVYTLENKKVSQSYEPRSLFEVEFLKRGFRWSDILVRYVAPLRLTVLKEMPYWTRKYSDQITFDKVNTVLHELVLHGRHVFDNFSPILLQSFEKEFAEELGYFKTTRYVDLLEETTVLEYYGD